MTGPGEVHAVATRCVMCPSVIYLPDRVCRRCVADAERDPQWAAKVSRALDAAGQERTEGEGDG